MMQGMDAAKPKNTKKCKEILTSAHSLLYKQRQNA